MRLPYSSLTIVRSTVYSALALPPRKKKNLDPQRRESELELKLEQQTECEEANLKTTTIFILCYSYFHAGLILPPTY